MRLSVVVEVLKRVVPCSSCFPGVLNTRTNTGQTNDVDTQPKGHRSEVSFFVGIDLGNEKHAVCVLNAQRKPPKGCIVKNDRGLLDVIMAAMGDVSPASVHIALEDRNNVVVDALLAAGFAVFTANPKQVDRLRDRATVAGAKDDRRDVSVLANAIATDARLFRRVAAQTESAGEVTLALPANAPPAPMGARVATFNDPAGLFQGLDAVLVAAAASLITVGLVTAGQERSDPQGKRPARPPRGGHHRTQRQHRSCCDDKHGDDTEVARIGDASRGEGPDAAAEGQRRRQHHGRQCARPHGQL